jgi:hypothetical protein
VSDVLEAADSAGFALGIVIVFIIWFVIIIGSLVHDGCCTR